MQIDIRRVDWEFKSPFRVSYRVRTHAQTVVAQLSDDGLMGRGESLGVSYLGDTADKMFDQLNNLVSETSELSLDTVQTLLPASGARNALDCALWDLEAKRTNCRVWERLGLSEPQPLRTAFTLSVEEPKAMAAAAAAAAEYSLLKLKLCGDGDVDRVRAVRRARPDAELVVDPNQGWTEQHLYSFAPKLAELGVKLIEQPLPIGKDEALLGFDSPIPLAADESCQTTESLPGLIGKYSFVNIKLDKCGGLTEAYRLARAAQAMGFRLMVGTMGGSSLSAAPAFLIAQLCEYADLDGPLWSREDVPNGLNYQGGYVSLLTPELWG